MFYNIISLFSPHDDRTRQIVWRLSARAGSRIQRYSACAANFKPRLRQKTGSLPEYRGTKEAIETGAGGSQIQIQIKKSLLNCINYNLHQLEHNKRRSRQMMVCQFLPHGWGLIRILLHAMQLDKGRLYRKNANVPNEINCLFQRCKEIKDKIEPRG